MTEQRAIRAKYDDECITLYQAYNKAIAEAAVKHQRLNASDTYQPHRTTWIKPSWCWMMYRSGYSYKDVNQNHILALRIKHDTFLKILRQAVLAHKPHKTSETTIVQWDPERSPRVGKLEYRSLQVGIPKALTKQFCEEWIESIEDVTDVARKMKEMLSKDPKVSTMDLIEAGLLPGERTYEVPEDIRENLEMG